MNYRSSHNIILKAFLKNNHIIPGQWLISKLSRFTRKVTSRWLRILCLYLLNKCHFTHQKMITSESLFFMWYCRTLFFLLCFHTWLLLSYKYRTHIYRQSSVKTYQLENIPTNNTFHISPFTYITHNNPG